MEYRNIDVSEVMDLKTDSVFDESFITLDKFINVFTEETDATSSSDNLNVVIEKSEKVSIKKRKVPFTLSEDLRIRELYKILGPCWAQIAEILKTRTRKQIRERYLNVLDENTNRDPFTEEEDLKIYDLYVKYGNKWAFISKFFPGRTTDIVRVRFHSHIKKKAYFFKALLLSRRGVFCNK